MTRPWVVSAWECIDNFMALVDACSGATFALDGRPRPGRSVSGFADHEEDGAAFAVSDVPVAVDRWGIDVLKTTPPYLP